MTESRNTQVFDLIDALPEEQKSLLVLETLSKVDIILERASQPGANPQEVHAILGLARSIIHVGGYCVSAQREANEGWTSTGDARVDNVWESMNRLMKDLTVGLSDLPESVQAKIKAGETLTDEDKSVLQKFIQEKTGTDLSDAELDVIVMDGDSPRPPAKNDDRYGGTGQYL